MWMDVFEPKPQIYIEKRCLLQSQSRFDTRRKKKRLIVCICTLHNAYTCTFDCAPSVCKNERGTHRAKANVLIVLYGVAQIPPASVCARKRVSQRVCERERELEGERICLC